MLGDAGGGGGKVGVSTARTVGGRGEVVGE
jgi:hypothetical protein